MKEIINSIKKKRPGLIPPALLLVFVLAVILWGVGKIKPIAKIFSVSEAHAQCWTTTGGPGDCPGGDCGLDCDCADCASDCDCDCGCGSE